MSSSHVGRIAGAVIIAILPALATPAQAGPVDPCRHDDVRAADLVPQRAPSRSVADLAGAEPVNAAPPTPDEPAAADRVSAGLAAATFRPAAADPASPTPAATPAAIPLPAGAWTGLAALSALAALSRLRKFRQLC